MENNFVTFLKRDVEIRSVKNLPEFFLHRTQNFLLIEPRTDRLANLRQQLGLLGLALRIVHDHVIFERETNLQSQADQQPQVRSAVQVAFRIWKQQHSEVMLTGLQTYGGNVANVLCRHCSSELLKATAGKHWQWLGHIRNIPESDEPAAAICQFTDVLACAACIHIGGELGGKAKLHTPPHSGPAPGNTGSRS